MKKLALFILLAVLPGNCANWYVEKSATGTNAGTSWTNAWNEMSAINFSSVACGDTIWLGGGTYGTTMTAVKNCSSGSTLNIFRVQSSDSVPVAAPGWSSAFDSQVKIVDWSGFAGFRLNGINNVLIDGRIKGNPLGASPVAYGISLQCNTLGTGGCDGIDDGAGNSNYTIQNVEVFGPPCVETATCGGSGASGVNLPNGGSGFTYNNMYVHRWGETFRSANWSGVTIQNSYIADLHLDGPQHEDVIYDNIGMQNFTFRWNKVWMSPNDGIFFDNGGQNGLYIYGNVMYHSGGALLTFPGRGTNPVNVFIYNNVWENDGNFGDFQPGWLYFESPVSGAMENNVFENVYINTNGGAGSTPTPTDYNAYNTCGDVDSGTHSFCYTSGTQFTNINTTNPLLSVWTLTSAGGTTFANGVALGSPFNVDPNGVTRGTPTWTIGAYQYPQAGGAGPPANIQGTAVLLGSAKLQ